MRCRTRYLFTCFFFVCKSGKLEILLSSWMASPLRLAVFYNSWLNHKVMPMRKEWIEITECCVGRSSPSEMVNYGHFVNTSLVNYLRGGLHTFIYYYSHILHKKTHLVSRSLDETRVAHQHSVLFFLSYNAFSKLES